MIDFLKSWILNIVTLAILMVLLEILVPSGKIKKFVDLVSGFVLLIAIISPFLGIFAKGLDLRQLQFSAGNFLDRREIQENGQKLEEKQITQMIGVYRQKVIQQLEEIAASVDGVTDARAEIMINEDYNSEKFGEIRRAIVEITMEGEKEGVKPVARVEKVQVLPKEQAASKEPDQSKKPDSRVSREIREKIETALQISDDRLSVTLMES